MSIAGRNNEENIEDLFTWLKKIKKANIDRNSIVCQKKVYFYWQTQTIACIFRLDIVVYIKFIQVYL